MQKRPKKGRRSRQSPGPGRPQGEQRTQSRGGRAGPLSPNRLLLHQFGETPSDDAEMSADVRTLIERLSQEQQASIEKYENSRARMDAMVEQLQTLFQQAVDHLESQTAHRVTNELKEQEALVERRLQQFAARLDAMNEKVAALRYSAERRPDAEVETAAPPQSRRLEVSVGFILLSALILLASFISASIVLNAYFAGG